MKIEISSYEERFAPEITAWPRNLDEARAWAGPKATFPFDSAELSRNHTDPDVIPFVAHCEGTLVGYAEIWLDEADIEIARIIVEPNHRRKGIGRAFVEGMIGRAAAFGLSDLYLRVVPENLIAIRCYESAGFVKMSPDEQATFNEDESINYVWMRFSAN